MHSMFSVPGYIAGSNSQKSFLYYYHIGLNVLQLFLDLFKDIFSFRNMKSHEAKSGKYIDNGAIM
jgi:hypothetical protein